MIRCARAFDTDDGWLDFQDYFVRRQMPAVGAGDRRSLALTRAGLNPT